MLDDEVRYDKELAMEVYGEMFAEDGQAEEELSEGLYEKMHAVGTYETLAVGMVQIWDLNTVRYCCENIYP